MALSGGLTACSHLSCSVSQTKNLPESDKFQNAAPLLKSSSRAIWWCLVAGTLFSSAFDNNNFVFMLKPFCIYVTGEINVINEPCLCCSCSVLTPDALQSICLNLFCLTMAGGIRRKKNNPSKKRDKRLGPIKVAYYTVYGLPCNGDFS